MDVLVVIKNINRAEKDFSGLTGDGSGVFAIELIKAGEKVVDVMVDCEENRLLVDSGMTGSDGHDERILDCGLLMSVWVVPK